MTRTPSKDRAEAWTARDVIRSCLFGVDVSLADEIVTALAFEGFEVVHPNERSTCYRDGFAEGMKRAAEICAEEEAAYLTPEYTTDQPLGSIAERCACKSCATSILAEIGER